MRIFAILSVSEEIDGAMARVLLFLSQAPFLRADFVDLKSL
jgi:hypothetical protein